MLRDKYQNYFFQYFFSYINRFFLFLNTNNINYIQQILVKILHKKKNYKLL